LRRFSGFDSGEKRARGLFGAFAVASRICGNVFETCELQLGADVVVG
jgi:hypothetical protein